MSVIPLRKKVHPRGFDGRPGAGGDRPCKVIELRHAQDARQKEAAARRAAAEERARLRADLRRL